MSTGVKTKTKATKDGLEVSVSIPYVEKKSLKDCPYYTEEVVDGCTYWNFQPKWFKTLKAAKKAADETIAYDHSSKTIFSHPELGFSFVPSRSSDECVIARTLRAFHPKAEIVDFIWVFAI